MLFEMNEDIFTRIDALLEQTLSNDDDGLGNLVRAIRQRDDYKLLVEWPLERDVGGFKRLSESVLLDRGCPRKLCFRALTLYLYASDACRSMDDDDSKREIMRTVKETIENYNIDWSLLIADKGCTKYSVAKKLIIFLLFAALTLRLCKIKAG